MARPGYARVSAAGQDTALQIRGLEAADRERIQAQHGPGPRARHGVSHRRGRSAIGCLAIGLAMRLRDAEVRATLGTLLYEPGAFHVYNGA